MPTINEVWEQAQLINANLVTVQNELTSLIQRSDETNDWLTDIRKVTADGLGNLSSGLVAVLGRQDVANQALAHLLQQEDTIICNLEKISRNTCLLLNEAAKQSAFQEKMAASLQALQHMYETTNPSAALAFARHQEDIKRIEKCCPPDPAEVPCAYQPCPAAEPIREQPVPDYQPYHPKPPNIRRTDRNPPG